MLMLWLFVGPTGVYLLDFFCSGIQFVTVESLSLLSYPKAFFKKSKGDIVIASVRLSVRPSVHPSVRYAISS